MTTDLQTPHTDELVKSGYAGILKNGVIVDRRAHPAALPLKESASLGVPAPKMFDEDGEPILP